MANRRCVTVSLSPETLDVAAALIANRRHGSVSEVRKHSCPARALAA